jgi:hypothetical protein
MQATYIIHADLRYVITTVEGSVTLLELGAHIQAIWSDPAWKMDYNGILDFSAATIDLSESEIRDLTKSMMADPRCSFGKWAFVVSTAAAFAKLREIEHVAGLRSTLRMFFDLRSAEEWLLSHGGTSRDPKGSP